MSKKIDIIDTEKKINKLFVKTNNYLIQNYRNQIISGDDYNTNLIKMYKDLFNARLVQNSNSVFCEIVFDNEKDYTMFLLRFN